MPLREPPTDVEVARLLAAVRGRIIRLLRRHDIDLEGSLDDERSDPLLLDSPVLAQLQGASVLGRVATGPRAGQRVLRLGSDPTAPVFTTGGPRHAHIEGFDLHANTAVHAGDNERLEHLVNTGRGVQTLHPSLIAPIAPHVPIHTTQCWRRFREPPCSAVWPRGHVPASGCCGSATTRGHPL